MRKITFSSLLGLSALTLVSASVLAESTSGPQSRSDTVKQNHESAQKWDGNVNTTSKREQEAGTAGQAPEQSTEVSKSEKNEMSRKWKTTLAPHTLMMETALISAIDQVKGLRTQYKTAEKTQSVTQKDFMDHFKMHGKEINDDFRMAMTHNGHLKDKVGKFPELSASEEYKSIDTAFSDISGLNKSWQGQLAKADYWKNKDQVWKDLETLEKRFQVALDRTRLFDSDKLDVTNVS